MKHIRITKTFTILFLRMYTPDWYAQYNELINQFTYLYLMCSGVNINYIISIISFSFAKLNQHLITAFNWLQVVFQTTVTN